MRVTLCIFMIILWCFIFIRLFAILLFTICSYTVSDTNLARFLNDLNWRIWLPSFPLFEVNLTNRTERCDLVQTRYLTTSCAMNFIMRQCWYYKLKIRYGYWENTFIKDFQTYLSCFWEIMKFDNQLFECKDADGSLPRYMFRSMQRQIRTVMRNPRSLIL